MAPPPFVGFKVPLEVAQKQGIPATAGPVEIKYRPVYEKGAGPRRTSLNNHIYQVQINGAMDITDTMELDGNLNLSGSHYFTTTTGLVRYKPLVEMINAGDVNFTLPEDKKSDISKAAHDLSKAKHSKLISFEPKISGAVVETETQSLSFALGGLVAYQDYLDTADEESKKIEKAEKKAEELTKAGKKEEAQEVFDTILGGAVGQTGEGDRMFGSLYGELSLLSFDMLEAQLAARTDYYYYSASESASGFTNQVLPGTEDVIMPVSPRLALSFQPIEELKLRASWGLGFRAPSLESIHQTKTEMYPFAIDYTNCPPEKFDSNSPSCAKGQHKVVLQGNKNLEPELSQSLNLGVILQPHDRFSFTVDYFMADRENMLSALGEHYDSSMLRAVLKHEQKYGVESLKKHKVEIKRNNANQVSEVKMPILNGSDFLNGLDLEVSLDLPIGSGWNFGLKMEHLHMLYQEIQFFYGADNEVIVPWYGWLEDLLSLENADPSRANDSTWYGVPRWRNRATFSVMNKDMGHKFDLIVHNIPGQGTLPESTEETDYYWQLDVVGGFTLNKKTNLIVGIRNIFDTNRPENEDDYLVSYINPTLYGIRGRSIDMRLTYDF